MQIRTWNDWKRGARWRWLQDNTIQNAFQINQNHHEKRPETAFHLLFVHFEKGYFLVKFPYKKYINIYVLFELYL